MSDLRSGSLSEYLPSRDAILAGLNKLSQSEEGARSFTGLPGESGKATHLLLYPTFDQSRFFEIAQEDVLGTELLSPEESPFGALGGMRVFVRQNAKITSGLAAVGQIGDDDFDLDIRLGMAGKIKDHEICEGTADGTTCAAECEDDTAGCDDTDGCGDATLGCTDGCPRPTIGCKTEITCGAEQTCHTCNQTCRTCETCHTCHTRCGGVCEIATRVTCGNQCELKP